MYNGGIIQVKKKLDDKYIDKIKNVNFQPIFIMGLHRSGTSILYKMLGETDNFTILTIYHLLNYDNLLYYYVNSLEEEKKEELNQLFKDMDIKTRKTDELKVTADYAHEYMYIFSQKNYPWKLTTENIQLFEELCKKLKYISGKNNPVLLKNPYDYPNFLFIKKNYPDAKLIFIHRNPLEVISSSMRLYETRLKSKDELMGLYYDKYNDTFKNPLVLFLQRIYYISCFPLGIFEVIRRSAKANKYFLKNIRYLSKEDYISITYEKLCMEPNKVITKILDLLNMKTDKDFSKYVKPRKLKLIPIVLFLRKFIYKMMKSYFKEFGYELQKGKN